MKAEKEKEEEVKKDEAAPDAEKKKEDDQTEVKDEKVDAEARNDAAPAASTE